MGGIIKGVLAQEEAALQRYLQSQQEILSHSKERLFKTVLPITMVPIQ